MEEKKNGFLKGFLAGILVVVVCLAISASIYIANTGRTDVFSLFAKETEETNAENESENAGLYEKIEEIQEIIDYYYLEEIDQNALEDGIYAGLVNGLDDPYSVYYTEDELASMLESTSGSYYGIGASMSQNAETGIITIVKPFEGTPAAEAGMLPGDILYEVEGEEVTGTELSTVVAKIKGGEGTTVNLTVYRDDEYIEMTVERRHIEIPTVSYEVLEDNIGYIEVTEFDEVTTEQFKEALTDLEAKGIEGLIIDLRNNPGGVLSVVVSMLEEILPEGLIVYTEDKYGNRTEYKGEGESPYDKPMVVLVNGNSASASEIFAGAVQDYGVGTIVGTTTYGKGIVQKIINLTDGTAVKLTISKYYTPNGSNIHGIGIVPDVEVELDEEVAKQVTIEHEEDNQLQKALEVIRDQQ